MPEDGRVLVVLYASQRGPCSDARFAYRRVGAAGHPRSVICRKSELFFGTFPMLNFCRVVDDREVLSIAFTTNDRFMTMHHTGTMSDEFWPYPVAD